MMAWITLHSSDLCSEKIQQPIKLKMRKDLKQKTPSSMNEIIGFHL
jgi:hypothetical protein